jgi:hypothetical protein
MGLKLIICAVLALSLSACATQDQKAFYKDIEGCSRHYTGSVSAGGIVVAPGFSGSVDVQCDPLLMTKANAAKIKADIAAAKAEVAPLKPPETSPPTP